ncbi:hypothetical protein Pan153_08610 [Gimesia panareensis]|uniref:Uncharacterized protein n=1 Tax=Gimesia panareensis TaxID=2527978 RepID=A0A518FIR3_9PLAN|nr:hypothetical protein [Gimesia panareensis]QDV16239.1 hypothetical protein Pan153_08610 [Gimesia panareensis]
MKQMIKDILVMLSFYLGIFILFVIVTRFMINHSGLAWTVIGIMAFMVLLGMLNASPGTGHVLDNAFSCIIVGILLMLSSLALNTTWNQMEAKEARAKQAEQVQPEGSK